MEIASTLQRRGERDSIVCGTKGNEFYVRYTHFSDAKPLKKKLVG